MATVRRIPLAEQTSGHLREGILSGRWRGRLPGMRPLAEDLGVSRHTLRAAIGLLVNEGILSEGEEGESYLIARATSLAEPPGPRPLRVALLLLTALSDEPPAEQANLMRIVGETKAEGHDCSIITMPAGKDTHKTGYLPRLVESARADAWIIQRGSLEVLEWFIAAGLPVLAMGGRSRDLPMATAGLSILPSTRAVVRRLGELGHRRIVFIAGRASRRPSPSPLLRAFREELALLGVRPGEFHAPDWTETPDGLVQLLDSLFQVTPPTALLCYSINSTGGTLSHLARRGIRVPEDVSVVSLHEESSLAWHFPGMRVAHLSENEELFFRRIRDWVASVSAGRSDTRQGWHEPDFIEGNTIGPAKAE